LSPRDGYLNNNILENYATFEKDNSPKVVEGSQHISNANIEIQTDAISDVILDELVAELLYDQKFLACLNKPKQEQIVPKKPLYEGIENINDKARNY